MPATGAAPALRTVDHQPHISHATYAFMRDEITRLQAQVTLLGLDDHLTRRAIDRGSLRG